MRNRSLFPVALLSAALLLSAGPADGIMIGLSTEHLTRNADTIVTGRVEDVRAQWSDDGKTIVSRATVRVADAVKGPPAARQIIVEVPGGEIDGIGFRVSDVAVMSPGEQVLLFLKDGGQTRTGGRRYGVLGKAQGKYTIDAQGHAKKSGYTLAAGSERVDSDLPLVTLLENIRSFMNEK